MPRKRETKSAKAKRAKKVSAKDLSVKGGLGSKVKGGFKTTKWPIKWQGASINAQSNE